jgi:hypothetical protein
MEYGEPSNVRCPTTHPVIHPVCHSIVVNDHQPNNNLQQQPSTTAFISHRSIIVGLSIDSNSTRTENGWNSEGESGRAYVFRLGQNTRSTQFPPESADEGTSDLSGASPFTYLGRITTEARGSGLGRLRSPQRSSECSDRKPLIRCSLLLRGLLASSRFARSGLFPRRSLLLGGFALLGFRHRNLLDPFAVAEIRAPASRLPVHL